MTTKHLLLALAGWALNCGLLSAAIRGPYGSAGNPTDATTTHLYHLDEATGVTPSVDAGSVPLALMAPEHNGATLGTPSFRPSFGGALDATDGGYDSSSGSGKDAGAFGVAPVTGAGDNVPVEGFWDLTTGAFSVDAIVKLGFDPSVPTTSSNRGSFNIVTLLDDSNTDEGARSFKYQFYLAPRGSIYAPVDESVPEQMYVGFEIFRDAGEGLGFEYQWFYAPIPEDAHAPVLDGWYHVAVTYNGLEATADNLKMYWTRMDGYASTEEEPTAANLLPPSSYYDGDTYAAATLEPASIVNFDTTFGPTGTSDLAIGNDAARGPNANFVGLVDEVRISTVARSATEFLFGESVGGLGGDFNLDGAVDGEDFLVWQRGLGSSHTAEGLLAWKANFGMSSLHGAAAQSVGAVPEPHAWALAVAASAILAAMRRTSWRRPVITGPRQAFA